MKDPSSLLRSFLKGLSWRLVSTAILLPIAWYFTGDLAVTGKIGVIDFTVKLGLFFLHERTWHQIKFGKRVDDPPIVW